MPSNEELARAQRFVPSMRRMDVEEALSLVPVLRADYLAEAIFEPDSRDIDVHGLHQGYLRALKARGGVIVTDAEVEAIERSGGDWSVRTRAGRLHRRPVWSMPPAPGPMRSRARPALSPWA